MGIIFFIKSSKVNFSNYTIKDIPGSSGRLDVISRCILAALIGENGFDKNIQIWVFLNQYGTLVFDTNLLVYDNFPKNELLLSDSIVQVIRNDVQHRSSNNHPLAKIKRLDIKIIPAIETFLKRNYEVFILDENGEFFIKSFKDIGSKDDIIFIIGDQSGKFVNSKELLNLNLKRISLGAQAYLASSVIRLIKLNLL
jgi:tRNA (pseudouridine54-N1)-methyltransferase